MDLPATDYDRIAALPNVKVLERSNDTWPWFISPNCEGVFADKRLRQALYYALDRQGYVDSVLGGHGRTIPSIPIQPGWALPPDSQLNMYEFNPDKAKQLLEEAGWDFDYVVRYFYYPGNKLRDSFAEIAQANLQAIGMKVDVTSMDVQRWIEVSTSGEWDLLQAGAGAFWDPHDWLERYGCDYWFTKGGRGHQRWCNPEWDALMLKAATLTTIEDRAPLYKEAVKIQNEEVPIIWFAAPTYMSAISTRLVGMEEDWDPNTNHLARFRDVHNWMLKQ
jgi:ABC-type transport system substrate-binding protein